MYDQLIISCLYFEIKKINIYFEQNMDSNTKNMVTCRVRYCTVLRLFYLIRLFINNLRNSTSGHRYEMKEDGRLYISKKQP